MSRQYYWKGSTLATAPSYGATSGQTYTNWINSGSLDVLSNWVSYVEYSNALVVGATQLPDVADIVTIRDVYPKIGTSPEHFPYQSYWLGTHSPCLNTTGKTLKVKKVTVGPFSSASNIPNNKWSEQNWVVGITSFAYPNFSASHGTFLGGSAGSTWNYGCPRVGGYLVGNTGGSDIQTSPLGITANTYPLGISSENIDIITENYNIWGTLDYGNQDIKLNRSPFAINIRTAVVVGATLYGGSNAVDGKCSLTIKTLSSFLTGLTSATTDSYMTHATNPWMENTSIKIANNSTLTTIKHHSGYVNELRTGDEVQFYQYYTGQQGWTMNSEAGGGDTYASAAVQLLSHVGNFITEYEIPSLWIAPKIYSNEYISQYFIQKSVARNWFDFASPQDTVGFTLQHYPPTTLSAAANNGSKWDISDTQMWPGVWNKTTFTHFSSMGYTAPPIPNYSVILGKQSDGGGTQQVFKFSSHKYSPHSTTSLSLLTPSTYGWPSSFPSIFLRGSVYIPDFCLDSGQLRVDPTNSIGSYGVNCGNGRITSDQPYPFVSLVRSNITEVIPTQYGGWNVHSPSATMYGLNIDSEWSGQIFKKDTIIRSHISPYIVSSEGELSIFEQGSNNISRRYDCPSPMEYVERVTPYQMIVDKDDDGYIGDMDIYLSIWGESVRDNFMGIYKPDTFLNDPTLLSADEELRKIELNILKTKRNKFVHGSNYNENACVNMVATTGNTPESYSLFPCLQCVITVDNISSLVSWGSNILPSGLTGEVSPQTTNEEIFRAVQSGRLGSGPQASCDGAFSAIYPMSLRVIPIPVFPYFFIIKECINGVIYLDGYGGGSTVVPPPTTVPCYRFGEQPATSPPPFLHPPNTTPSGWTRRDRQHHTPLSPPPSNPNPGTPLAPPIDMPPCPIQPPVMTPPNTPGGGRRSSSLEYNTNDQSLPESPTHFSPLPPRYQPFA